jgi:plastocyanin
MKKILLLCAAIGFIFSSANSADVNITINGFAYSPATVVVNVGDNVIFNGNFGFHPTLQVSQATWNANGTTPLAGGFSYTTGTSQTLPITAAMAGTTIYYLCTVHVLSGMKGQISVNVAAGVRENQVRDFNFTVFPTPVTAGSWLNMSIKKAGRVTVSVYDLHGRLVGNPVNTVMQAGETTIPFDAAKLQKGTYILLMRTAGGDMRKRILVQ